MYPLYDRSNRIVILHGSIPSLQDIEKYCFLSVEVTTDNVEDFSLKYHRHQLLLYELYNFFLCDCFFAFVIDDQKDGVIAKYRSECEHNKHFCYLDVIAIRNMIINDNGLTHLPPQFHIICLIQYLL